MMKLSVAALSLLMGAVDAVTGSNLRIASRSIVDTSQITQEHRSLAEDMMMGMPGKRVAGMDRTNAVCSASISYDTSVPMEESVIEYYYAIESTYNITTSEVDGSMMVRDLEETLFHAINPAILWCYYDETNVGKRNLMERRRMTLEEARRLSIVTFSTTPEDEETDSEYERRAEAVFVSVPSSVLNIIFFSLAPCLPEFPS